MSEPEQLDLLDWLAAQALGPAPVAHRLEVVDLPVNTGPVLHSSGLAEAAAAAHVASMLGQRRGRSLGEDHARRPRRPSGTTSLSCRAGRHRRLRARGRWLARHCYRYAIPRYPGGPSMCRLQKLKQACRRHRTLLAGGIWKVGT